jgi:hypothetical protein
MFHGRVNNAVFFKQVCTYLKSCSIYYSLVRMCRWLPVSLTGMCQATTFCSVRIRFHLKTVIQNVAYLGVSRVTRVGWGIDGNCCVVYHTAGGFVLSTLYAPGLRNLVVTFRWQQPLVSNGNRRNVTYWNGSATMCFVYHCQQCNNIECWTYIFYGLFMSLSILLTCFGIYLFISSLFIYLSLFFIYLLILIIYLSSFLFLYLSSFLFIYLSLLFIYSNSLFISFHFYLFVYLYFYLFVYLSSLLFIYLSLFYVFIYLFIYLLNNIWVLTLTAPLHLCLKTGPPVPHKLISAQGRSLPC